MLYIQQMSSVYSLIADIFVLWVIIGDVHGIVVKLVDFKLLAPHHCGFESQHGLNIFSCEETIQQAYRMLVVVLRCPFVSPPVKLGHRHNYDL
jgi:hypothetical protein